MIGTGAPPQTNLDDDDEMRELEDSADDEMRYSPASLGKPMSVQQLAQCRETATTGPQTKTAEKVARAPAATQWRSQTDSRAGVSQFSFTGRGSLPNPPVSRQGPVVQLPCGPARPGIRNSTTAEPESVRQQSRSQQRQQSRSQQRQQSRSQPDSQPDCRAGVRQTAEPKSAQCGVSWHTGRKVRCAA